MERLPTQQDVIWLFDVVWPCMEYAAAYRDKCLAQLLQIQELFAQSNNFNTLLNHLDVLPDIGLVIGTGLIFCVNQDTMVPFDKYTTGWALELKVIPDNFISQGNYISYSRKVADYVASSKLRSILEFVREAQKKTAYPCPPE